VAIADTFDAMTSDRPYRASMTPTEAFDKIERVSGTQLDPECTQAFLKLRPRIEKLLQDRGAVTVAAGTSASCVVRASDATEDLRRGGPR
jgi:HD-GYP domain-containing protein (c-di-GMP phosphodiesterase class II)